MKCQKTIIVLVILAMFVAVPLSHAANYEEAVGYWKFDGDVIDSNGNDTGSLSPGWAKEATMTTNLPASEGWSIEGSGYSRYLSDGKLYVNTPSNGNYTAISWNSVNFNTGLTAEVTVKLDSSMPSNYIALSTTNYGANYSGLYFNSGGVFLDGQGTVAVDKSEFHTYRYTVDGSATKLYVDGEHVSSGSTRTIGWSGNRVTFGECDTAPDFASTVVYDSFSYASGVHAPASYSSGQHESALDFSSSSDRVELGTSSAFRQGSAITYSFWANIGQGGGGYAMGAGGQGGQGCGGVSVSGNKLAYYWTPSDGSDAGISIDLEESYDVWNHYAISMDYVNNSAKLFFNGEEIAYDLTRDPSGSWVPYAGYDYNAGKIDAIGGRYVNSWYSFDGMLDDVGLWDRALDANEIAAIYDVGIEAFEYLSMGSDTLTLGMTTEEIAQLAQLYVDGKAGLEPDAVMIGGTEWYYYADELDGRSYGDSWTDSGYSYFYLGSGVTTDPALGGAVPELPPFAAQALLLGCAGIGLWVKRVRA